MGDFNLNSPTIRGMEWRPDKIRQKLLDAPTKGIAMRFKSGGAVTVSAIDYFASAILGSPGLGIEVLTTLVPTDRQVTSVFLATAGSTSNMQNQSAAAPAVGDVDDIGTLSDYWRNTSPRIGIPATYTYGRGGVTALVGRRIEKLAVKAIVKATAESNLHTAMFWNPFGTVSPVSLTTIPGDNTWRTYDLLETSDSKYLNRFDIPSHPWSLADVNNFIAPAAVNGWGVWSSYLPGTLYVASLWMEVTHVAENRVGSYYNDTLPITGAPIWGEATLASTSAMTANTWYYLHLFNMLNAASDRYWSVPVLGMDTPRTEEATAASDTTKEHRKVYETTINRAGVVQTVDVTSYGEMLPVLFDRSGTIESQSQPYAQITGDGVPGTALVNTGTSGSWGTEVTSAAGVSTYHKILAAIGWEDTAQRPDAPLTLEIRRGAGSMTGGGTLDATAVLNPEDLATGDLQDVAVSIANGAGFATQAGATQYFIRAVSTATVGRGWKLGLAQVRSGSIFAGGPSVAELQGASQGGTTDSLFTSGTEVDDFELVMAFGILPTGPAGFTATAAVAS